MPLTLSDNVKFIEIVNTRPGRSPLLMTRQEEPKHEMTKGQYGAQDSKQLSIQAWTLISLRTQRLTSKSFSALSHGTPWRR